MARFYSNENVPMQVVLELRRLGHDVLTTLDAGKANSAVPDPEVLAFAVAEGRVFHNIEELFHNSGPNSRFRTASRVSSLSNLPRGMMR